MPKYVPPHLRPNYKPDPAPAPAPAPLNKPRRPHFKSNASGLRSENEAWHRFTVKVHRNSHTPTKAERFARHSRALSKRKVRKTPFPKGIVKGTHKVKRAIKSASPKRVQKKKFTVKSK